MIEWLRTLSPASRYLVYVAGVFLMLFVAVGVGATAAVVVGWQSGRVATDSAETGTLESSKSETTGAAKASEATGIEPSSDSKNSKDTIYKDSFILRATDENSRGDYTIIDDPSMNGDPNAIVLVSDQKNPGSASYEHNIGVWYAGTIHRWAIFNQDRVAVPAGATFRVEVPKASACFVHHAGLLHTAGNYTYLDNPLTNGEPDAVLSVTQNWNPGGGAGVYNNHPIGAVYDAKLKKWALYNRDGAPMPKGAAFNVAVSANANERAR
ncbi:MAG: hypothetical protein M3317_07640 [Actinomycetota bacterium]|nr:hypothetical protein [Actinomycetota bacterium]